MLAKGDRYVFDDIKSTLVLTAVLLICSGICCFWGCGFYADGCAERKLGSAGNPDSFPCPPRLTAILCTDGHDVAADHASLCMNKFVSPTTGATISFSTAGNSVGALISPGSTLWVRAGFAFAAAIAGTWIFVAFVQRIQFKDVVMVPLVGIMFGTM